MNEVPKCGTCRWWWRDIDANGKARSRHGVGITQCRLAPAERGSDDEDWRPSPGKGDFCRKHVPRDGEPTELAGPRTESVGWEITSPELYPELTFHFDARTGREAILGWIFENKMDTRAGAVALTSEVTFIAAPVDERSPAEHMILRGVKRPTGTYLYPPEWDVPGESPPDRAACPSARITGNSDETPAYAKNPTTTATSSSRVRRQTGGET